MEKHKEMTSKTGSLWPLLAAVIAIAMVIGLYLYFTNAGKNNPFVKKPAFNPCANSTGDKTATITISSTGVTPASVMICPGQEIKWVNNDAAPHTFIVTSKGIDSARLRAIDAINPQESVNMSFETSGTITYSVYSTDPGFKGEIIVK